MRWHGNLVIGYHKAMKLKLGVLMSSDWFTQLQDDTIGTAREFGEGRPTTEFYAERDRDGYEAVMLRAILPGIVSAVLSHAVTIAEQAKIKPEKAPISTTTRGHITYQTTMSASDHAINSTLMEVIAAIRAEVEGIPR